MENRKSPSFRQTNLVLQFIYESQITCKPLMRWSSRKKEESICCTVYFVRTEFFKDLCFIPFYSVLNTLSE